MSLFLIRHNAYIIENVGGRRAFVYVAVKRHLQLSTNILFRLSTKYEYRILSGGYQGQSKLNIKNEK